MNMDCVEGMRLFPDAYFDSIVTDPPYELGFMGKTWDASGIAYSVEMWREALRVLKPGGHLLAFSGSRTYHRMVCAIEDAGFEIRDQIMWVYGSGFPKSLDVSKAIDKAAGAVREVIGKHANPAGNKAGGNSLNMSAVGMPDEAFITAPATDAARQWQGWGTALKPSHEPIVVARKPLKSADINVLASIESQLRKRGVCGEILWKPENVKGAASSSRPISSSSTAAPSAEGTSARSADAGAKQRSEPPTPKSSEPITPLGESQSGSTSAATTSGNETSCETRCWPPMAAGVSAAESLKKTSSPSTTSTVEEASTGSQSTGRFTLKSSESDFQATTESFAGIATGLTGSMALVHIKRDSAGFFLWPKSLPEVMAGTPLTVAANVLLHGTGAINVDACRVEGAPRNPGFKAPDSAGIWGGSDNSALVGYVSPDGRWPANLIHDGSEEVLATFPNEAGRFFYAAKCSQADRNDGLENFTPATTSDGPAVAADNAYQRGKTERLNTHPTVKPTQLMRYLCRLVTPPGGTVMDPFTGSGSTGKAAKLEGFGFIGFELSEEYTRIATARIAGAKE